MLENLSKKVKILYIKIVNLIIKFHTYILLHRVSMYLFFYDSNSHIGISITFPFRNGKNTEYDITFPSQICLVYTHQE